MSKEELEEVIEYEDEYYEENFIEEQEELSDNDQVEQDSKGQVKFKSVNHHKRAEANEVESDEEMSTYANYALEYFNHRCALSGESFVIFDKPVQREKNNRITTNLSAEHIVALTTGGNDIIPNIVPTVLQYNVQKNGYYILDWWPKAKDINGNSIYSPEKLLKLVNYMLKSLQIRKELGIKKQPREYRKRLLTSNEIDEFLMQEEISEKLLSDTITATTEVEDKKSILTQIPKQEGTIPNLAKQKDKEIKITEAMFLTDALEVLEREERIPKEIISELQNMYKKVEGEIPFEIEVRKRLLFALEQIGIENNKYTVASSILVNTNILDQVRQNQEEIQNIIKEYLEKQIEELKEVLPEEYIKEIMSCDPEVIYSKKAVNELKNIIDLYKKYINEKQIDISKLKQAYLVNILKIKEWMDKNKTTIPPNSNQNKGKTRTKEELILGKSLGSIRYYLIKPYKKLKTEEEKAEYRKQHPELEEVMAIVEEIDRNNTPVKEEQPYYINILKIKEWMDKNKTTTPPNSNQNKDKTRTEEELTLGWAFINIRKSLIKPYKKIETEEEKAEYRRQHPELEEVMAIVEEIDRNNIPIKEEQIYYINIVKIKEWMDKNNTTRPPSSNQNKDKTKTEEELTLGTALSTIRHYLIKPYKKIETEEEKAEYRRQHPELEEVMAIVEEIDRNNIPIKEEQIYYINIVKIKEWMDKNNTTRPPSSNQNKDKTKTEEELTLGTALNSIRKLLIKPYKKLESEEEKAEYRRQHPELEEVMEIVEEIDRNNPKNKKKIKDTVKQNKDNLSEAMQSGEELEAEILMAEKVSERSVSDGRGQ